MGGTSDAPATADADKAVGSQQVTLSCATVEVTLRAAVLQETETEVPLAPEVEVVLLQEAVTVPSFVRATVDAISPEDMTNRVTVVIMTTPPTLGTRTLI